MEAADVAGKPRNGTTQVWRMLRRRALRELPHVCAHCDLPLNADAPREAFNSMQLDHIVPVAKGGGDVFENVQWSCPGCNKSRGDRLDWSPDDPRYIYINGQKFRRAASCKVHDPVTVGCPHSGALR
jgi:5-methylcytosine-specific restriction endonuclease McrA